MPSYEMRFVLIMRVKNDCKKMCIVGKKVGIPLLCFDSEREESLQESMHSGQESGKPRVLASVRREEGHDNS